MSDLSYQEFLPGGRRIYIHALSFRDFCESSEHNAVLVYQGLVGVFLRKFLFNRLLQDARIFGFLSEAQRDVAKSLFDDLPISTVSSVLRQLRFDYRGLGSTRELRRVLTDEEEVCATCFDDNYYTFATGYEAAYRMYNDFERISELRRLVREAPSDQRVMDLTIIRGRVLRRFGQEEFFERASPAKLRESRNNAFELNRKIACKLFADLEARLGQIAALKAIEQNVYDALEQSLEPVY